MKIQKIYLINLILTNTQIIKVSYCWLGQGLSNSFWGYSNLKTKNNYVIWHILTTKYKTRLLEQYNTVNHTKKSSKFHFSKLKHERTQNKRRKKKIFTINLIKLIFCFQESTASADAWGYNFYFLLYRLYSNIHFKKFIMII